MEIKSHIGSPKQEDIRHSFWKRLKSSGLFSEDNSFSCSKQSKVSAQHGM